MEVESECSSAPAPGPLGVLYLRVVFVLPATQYATFRLKVSDLVGSAVYKLRKHVEQVEDTSEEDEEIGDDFENLYKGEISKSGVPILPSKRARKTPEKIQVSK